MPVGFGYPGNPGKDMNAHMRHKMSMSNTSADPGPEEEGVQEAPAEKADAVKNMVAMAIKPKVEKAAAVKDAVEDAKEEVEETKEVVEEIKEPEAPAENREKKEGIVAKATGAMNGFFTGIGEAVANLMEMAGQHMGELAAKKAQGENVTKDEAQAAALLKEIQKFKTTLEKFNK